MALGAFVRSVTVCSICYRRSKGDQNHGGLSAAHNSGLEATNERRGTGWDATEMVVDASESNMQFALVYLIL